MIKNIVVLTAIIAGLLFITVDAAFSVDWMPANQATLQWTACTTFDDGKPLPEGDQVSYEVFWVKEGANRLLDVNMNPATQDTQDTITFTEEGKYFLGVRALRLHNNEIVSRSQINWTDNTEAMKDGLSRGVIYFKAPDRIKSLEILGDGN